MSYEFPPHTKAEWLAKVEKDLRGKPLEGLNFTVAGQTFSPFHHPEDLPEPPPPVRGPRTEPCRSGVSLEITDSIKDNKIILDLLNKGANALFLHSETVDLEANLDDILNGVYRDFIHVYLMYGEAEGSFRSLQGQLFETATTVYGGDEPTERIGRMMKNYADALANGPVDNPTFWVEVDDDYLTSIARLRAVRLCYRLVADAYGVSAPCHIVADPMTKLKDKYGGMISTPANVTAALVGGADTVFVPSGASDDPKEKAFLRRVAVNSYNVLDHEAYLNRVADPAAGSYYLEQLTEQIARNAWSKFQELQS